MNDANPRTQCARLFDSTGLGWRCTRPIGHQGQHCSSTLRLSGNLLTRYRGQTVETPVVDAFDPCPRCNHTPHINRECQRTGCFCWQWSSSSRANVRPVASHDMGGEQA